MIPYHHHHHHHAPQPPRELQIVNHPRQYQPRPQQLQVINAPVNPYQTVQQIVHTISRTVPQTQRRQVLESTLRFLAHNDTALHNYEVDMGADRALCLQLGYLDMLQSSSPTNGDSQIAQQQQVEANRQHSQEQFMICGCLLRIYQCSRERRVRSFHEIGHSDLLPILVKILKRYATTRTTTPPQQQSTPPSSDTIISVLHLIRVFAKLDTPVKSSLIRWRDGKLIVVLQGVLVNYMESSQDQQYQDMSNQHCLMIECLGIYKDLSFRLDSTDKECLYRFLGVMLPQYILGDDDNVQSQSSTTGKMLEAASAIFWNFATSTKISLELAQQEKALQLLQRMLEYHGDGGGETQEGGETLKASIRRNAMSALGNIVSALTTTQNIAASLSVVVDEGKKSVFYAQAWIIPTLIGLTKGEGDPDTQRRAMRTIRCLASCPWGRNLLWKESSVVSYLSSFLVGNSNSDIATRIQACEAVGHLTEDTDRMKQIGPDLEIALVRLVENLKDQRLESEEADTAALAAAACKALRICLENSPWKRGSSSYLSDTFFGSILKFSKLEIEVTHPPIAKLLRKLVAERKERRPEDAHHDSENEAPHLCERQQQKLKGRAGSEALLSPPVLDTLAELLIPLGPQFEKSRCDALDVIQILLEVDGNKSVLAGNDGLLSAVVGFALGCTETDRKNRAKQIILELVPQI